MYQFDEEEPTRKEIRYKPVEADVYVKCPYFPEHELRRSRMPYHLMKCQNNPNAPKLLACPFNYMHRVRPEDQQEHFLTCEDRISKRYSDRTLPSYNKTVKSQSSKFKVAALMDDQSTSTPNNVAPPPETGEKDWW